jgi:hypothetical protein
VPGSGVDEPAIVVNGENRNATESNHAQSVYRGIRSPNVIFQIALHVY